MTRTILFSIIILIGSLSQTTAQNTVGLLSYDQTMSSDGYNLMFPHNQPTVYLLNACGEIVHTWEDEANFRPGNMAYILDSGNLLKAKRDAQITDDAIWAGGGGETIELRSWDNELLWTYTINNDSLRMHHDIAPMDNGHVLAIVWELYTDEELVLAGKDTTVTTENSLWPEMIVEIDPTTSEIVWEWHVMDHIVQDFDATRDNFGVISDNPKLVNINFEDGNFGPDWLHSNSITYNEELDQIMVSIPTFNEFWVIDHSTTTQEAAGHLGGLGGHGGDLMYRWGNPLAYDRGTVDDQMLFYQHDAHWVTDVPFLHPHYGKIAVFNNRVGADYSEATFLLAPWDMYEWEYTIGADAFGPDDFAITIQHPEPTSLYSTGLSSLQSLPNGNTLICSGRYGYSLELTPDNEIVWEYKTPIIAGAPATQGDEPTINQNLTFRMNRYELDHPAFIGQDLSPQGWIELNPDEDYCQELINSVPDFDEYIMGVYPNPTSGKLVIEWMSHEAVEVRVTNLTGQLVYSSKLKDSRAFLDLTGLSDGLYLLQVGDSKVERLVIDSTF